MRTNVIIPRISLDEVLEITIPLIEDVRNLETDVLRKCEWWWLRSAGYHQNFSAYVYSCGNIREPGYYVDCAKIAVRPCFSIPYLKLTKGDKVFVENTSCTVIAEDFVLADKLICYHMFDENNNDWETSSLKQYIESEEFSEMIIKGTHM